MIKIIRKTKNYWKNKKLLEELKRLNLPKSDCLIYGSGPLGIRGIREIHDLDVVIKNSLYKKLLKRYPEKKDEEKRFIKIGNIELIPVSWSLIKNFKKAYKRADEIEGFKFVSLEDLILWKKKMGRQKDFKDIQLIENYLKKRKVIEYNKLIRDKILEIIEKDKRISFWRILDKKRVFKRNKEKNFGGSKRIDLGKKQKRNYQ